MSTIDLNVEIVPSTDHILLSVISPDGSSRKPLNVCCVVDISGSMDTEATITNDKGNKESHGFTVLDVVKHGVKTIIACLNDTDSFSLVVFETDVEKICEMKSMTTDAKKQATDYCTNLATKGCTNLWGGLEMGLNILKEDHSKTNALFLLTDGQPNEHPEGGELSALQRYKDQCHGGRLPASINLFGFGYSMDGKLLNDLAVIGGGFYSFIPDSSFVGTAFVNSISNIMCTAVRNLVISVSPDDKSSIISSGAAHRSYVHYMSGKDIQFQLGSLFMGQTLCIPIASKLHGESRFDVDLSFVVPGESEPQSISKSFGAESLKESDKTLALHIHRMEFVSAVKEILISLEDKCDKQTLNFCHKLAKSAASHIDKSSESKEPFVIDLLKDLTGQVSEAVSKLEYFNKWGKHYLPSLMGAHLMQVCNNFKDPGVQHYGGELFKKTRESLDEIFIQLPPPKPSIKHSNVRPVSSMRSYYRSSAPCFTENSVIETMHGPISIGELKSGDKILNFEGSFSSVECIVKTFINSECNQPIAKFDSGLEITPWHPVYINDSWRFPIDCADNIEECEDIDVVYSLVIKDRKSVIVNGIECATLGHGLTGNIIGHEYFGTDMIIRDLRRLPGWKDGVVSIQIKDIIRCNKTNEVIGIAFEKNFSL